jgi:hypothetical protein
VRLCGVLHSHSPEKCQNKRMSVHHDGLKVQIFLDCNVCQ